MRELLVVLQREFFERVRTRSFILSTLLIPLLIMGFGAFGILLGRSAPTPDLHLVIVDDTSAELGVPIRSALEADGGFTVDLIRAPLAEVRDSLSALVRARQIDGYLGLSPNLPEGEEVEVRTARSLSAANRVRIRAAVTPAVQRERFRRVGLAPEDVLQLLQPVTIRDTRVDEPGVRERRSGQSEMGYVAAIVLLQLIVLYGTQVMRSAQEEKANRISEILVSSVSAPKLMLGKVLGVGFAALLQVAVWLVLFSLPFLYRSGLESIGVPVGEIVAVLAIVSLGTVGVVAAFAILGFFLYATLFAAVGAAAETIEDAQRFTLPLLLPLMFPIFLAGPIGNDPSSTIAVVASWFPLTMPAAMPMRLFSGGAGMAEAAASLVLLFFSVIAVGWLAGRIYRAAILNTGRGARWGDVLGWLRARA